MLVILWLTVALPNLLYCLGRFGGTERSEGERGEGNEWKVKGGKEEEGKKRNETFHVRQEGEIISGNNGREKRLEKDSKSGYKEKLKTMRLSRLRLQGGNKEGDRKQ